MDEQRLILVVEDDEATRAFLVETWPPTASARSAHRAPARS
jgi:hypothetical protein